FGFRELLPGHAVSSNAIDLRQDGFLDAPEGNPLRCRQGDRVKKWMLRRQQAAAYRRGESRLDKGLIQARAPLWWWSPEAGPEVEAFGAAEDGVENEHRKEVVVGHGR